MVSLRSGASTEHSTEQEQRPLEVADSGPWAAELPAPIAVHFDTTGQAEQDDPASSGSDSDTEGEGAELTALAAGMWRALGQNRGFSVSTSQAATAGEAAGQHSEEMEELGDTSWRPQTGLPSATPQAGDRRIIGLPSAERGVAKQFVVPPRDPKTVAAAAKAAAGKTRGWFDLPRAEITDEVKRDLRLLRLRGVMDPKRFYKNPDATKFPTHFAMGTVVEGPGEFNSARLTGRQRKATLTEELLADETMQASRKRRYATLQEEASRGSRKKKPKSGARRDRPHVRHHKH